MREIRTFGQGNKTTSSTRAALEFLPARLANKAASKALQHTNGRSKKKRGTGIAFLLPLPPTPTRRRELPVALRPPNTDCQRPRPDTSYKQGSQQGLTTHERAVEEEGRTGIASVLAPTPLHLRELLIALRILNTKCYIFNVTLARVPLNGGRTVARHALHGTNTLEMLSIYIA